MKALETALYARLSGDAALLALLPGGVHNLVAPQPTARYAVFQKVSGPADYTFTQRIGTSYLYQIRCIDPSGAADKDSLMDALARIDTLLTRQALAVAGYTTWLVERSDDLPDSAEADEDGRVYIQVGASYRLELGG